MTAVESLRDFDAAAELKRIGEFLRQQLAREPRRHGYVVGLSGGIDSAVMAATAVAELGPAAVLGVLLPEREGMDESLVLGRLVAEQLAIEKVEIDLTEAIETMGVYARRETVVRAHFPEFGQGWSYRLVLPGDLRTDAQMNVYRLEVVAPDGQRETKRLRLSDFRTISAATNVKQRLRMVSLYEQAEGRGYLVCGTTNRTEVMQGFFVAHGDGGVDVEPLAHLFKTEIFCLARHLEIPEAIIARKPSPDTYSAPVDDSEFYFRLPYEVVDAMLQCADVDVELEALAAAHDLDLDVARRIRQELSRRMQLTTRLRELPPALSRDDAEKGESSDR